MLCVVCIKIQNITSGVANGKSETRRDAETGTLKSETETEKFSDSSDRKEYYYMTDRHKV